MSSAHTFGVDARGGEVVDWVQRRKRGTDVGEKGRRGEVSCACSLDSVGMGPCKVAHGGGQVAGKRANKGKVWQAVGPHVAWLGRRYIFGLGTGEGWAGCGS
uniref:Uncharacterized protein n=2 Tax=Oryza TaxID=4527 RepID=A0A0D3HL42_9ORYZ